MGTYTPTVWQDGSDGGTPITADRLNNIETGISASVPKVGERISSTVEINPAARFGGTWQYLEEHMLSGQYIYERTA